MRMGLKQAILPALLLTVLPTALAHGVTYQTYTNVRFGYRVDYPVPELIPQPEAPNGDGRVFRSADGQAEMRVFGAFLLPELGTWAQLYQQELHKPGLRVTYRLRTPRMFVVSGYEDGGQTIYYTRRHFRDGLQTVLMLHYPRTQRQRYDPITAHVSRSLREVAGLERPLPR